ncbi:MAG: hypothetical protein PHD97_11385 [Bacteroidales bacterium]|nr:hypothetical protein [Bacteroidales bacterium]
MKNQRLTIFFLIGLTACNSFDKKTNQIAKTDTTKPRVKIIDSLPKTESFNLTKSELDSLRKKEISDSLTAIKTLKLALRIANKKKIKGNFILRSDTLQIKYGNIFNYGQKHLLIKRIFQWGIYLDIFKLQDSTFKKILSKEIQALTYIGDTIRDVNGDNKLDYLVHWYPLAGCCLRDIFDVYLQKENCDFSEEFEFINPTFFLDEKVIRGLCYGWNAPLYKFEWKDFSIDTIEYIYMPDNENKKSCSKKNDKNYVRRKHEDRNEKGEILKGLPNEYKNLKYIDY